MTNQLLNCARCGKPVSSGVSKCPHCSEKKFKYIPCHHCNKLTKEFEIIDYYRRSKCFSYCSLCYNSIIKVNQNIPLPAIPQVSVQCPTCNHLFKYQLKLTYDYHVFPPLHSLSAYHSVTRAFYMTCPNCGERNCECFFSHPYVRCSWCGGVLNYSDGVEVYHERNKPYKSQDKIYLHKNCATTKNILELNAKYYSPLELFLAKLNWFSEHLFEGVASSCVFMVLFLIIHLFLNNLYKIDILYIFLIVSIAIGVYTVYTSYKNRNKKRS